MFIYSFIQSELKDQSTDVKEADKGKQVINILSLMYKMNIYKYIGHVDMTVVLFNVLIISRVVYRLCDIIYYHTENAIDYYVYDSTAISTGI